MRRCCLASGTVLALAVGLLLGPWAFGVRAAPGDGAATEDVVEGIVDGPPETPVLAPPAPAPASASRVTTEDGADRGPEPAGTGAADGDGAPAARGSASAARDGGTTGTPEAGGAAPATGASTAAASLGAGIEAAPGEEFVLDELGQPFTPWSGRNKHAIGICQVLFDRSETEATFGFEFSGFDPYDEDRIDWLKPNTASKWAARYRAGLAYHSYVAPGRLPGTFRATDLTLLTLGFGYDYAFRRRARTPFASAYLIGVLPFRNHPLPARDDRMRVGVGLGGGQVTRKTLARVEYQLLEGDTDALVAGFGWRF